MTKNKYFISVFKTKDTVAYSYWLKGTHFYSNIWTLYWISEPEIGEERMNFKEESSRNTTFWTFRKKCSLLALWWAVLNRGLFPGVSSLPVLFIPISLLMWLWEAAGHPEVTQKVPAGIRKTARVLDCRLLDATDGWACAPTSSEPCLNITLTLVPRSPELRWCCKEKFNFCVSWAFKPRKKYFCP